MLWSYADEQVKCVRWGTGSIDLDGVTGKQRWEALIVAFRPVATRGERDGSVLLHRLESLI